jgi:hypothetical protein
MFKIIVIRGKADSSYTSSMWNLSLPSVYSGASHLPINARQDDL